MSAPTTPTTITGTIRSAVGTGMARAEHDKGLPTVYRSALDDPLVDTPGEMLAVLTSVAGDRSATVAELAARDALALWATVSRATKSHHANGQELGSAARRAARKHESSVGAAMGDLPRARTRRDLLAVLTTLLRLCQSTGAGVDYMALSESLYRIYQGTPTRELNSSPVDRWVRQFYTSNASSDD